MLESGLFFLTLLAACAVVLWASLNDQHERQDPLSRVFAMKQATKAAAATGKARRHGGRVRRPPQP